MVTIGFLHRLYENKTRIKLLSPRPPPWSPPFFLATVGRHRSTAVGRASVCGRCAPPPAEAGARACNGTNPAPRFQEAVEKCVAGERRVAFPGRRAGHGPVNSLQNVLVAVDRQLAAVSLPARASEQALAEEPVVRCVYNLCLAKHSLAPFKFLSPLLCILRSCVIAHTPDLA